MTFISKFWRNFKRSEFFPIITYHSCFFNQFSFSCFYWIFIIFTSSTNKSI